MAVTPAEQYLENLCNRTFLSLWSYSGIYRDQGRNHGNGAGKEVCDLLVVFENHVIIFSDKACRFPDTGSLELDWRRWCRRAVVKSAEQIWGAERWILSHSNRLYLDSGCTVRFPLEIRQSDKLEVHRVVVAHGVSARCAAELGGSGSLMIAPNPVSSIQGKGADAWHTPFTVGDIDPTKGFVHVLDDTSLEIVMKTLDTITDFVAYLSRKEQLIRSGTLAFAAGEEELLAYYLADVNEDGEHDFVFPGEFKGVAIDEGFWERFLDSRERRAQQRHNQVSYAWDKLIETFAHHISNNTQYFPQDASVAEQEQALRFLAREPRTRRRMLGTALLDIIAKSPLGYRAARVILPSGEGEPHYVFLLLPTLSGVSEDEYRQVRLQLLSAYCMAVKVKFPVANHIVGIATETGLATRRSEDVLYLDARTWSNEDQLEAEALRRDLGLLVDLEEFHGTEQEYPGESDIDPHLRIRARLANQPRNRPCLCGSGRKFKHCHGVSLQNPGIRKRRRRTRN